jgi:hypothetical protein
MRDHNHSMNKACRLAGMKQQTVFSRFQKFPHLKEVVAGRAEIPDGENNEQEEENDEIEEMDMDQFARGRGRKNDVPFDVEAAIARKIEKAIARMNAPTTFAILKKLVQKVWSFLVWRKIFLLIVSNTTDHRQTPNQGHRVGNSLCR